MSVCRTGGTASVAKKAQPLGMNNICLSSSFLLHCPATRHLVMYISNRNIPPPITVPMMTLSLRRLRAIMVMMPFNAGTWAAVLPIRLATLLSIWRCPRKSVRVAYA